MGNVVTKQELHGTDASQTIDASDCSVIESPSTKQLFANLKKAILWVGNQYEYHKLNSSDIEKMCEEFAKLASHLNGDPSLIDIKSAIYKVSQSYKQQTLNDQDVVKLYITFAEFSLSIDDLL